MLYHEQSEDYRPLFWIQGRPVYATVFLMGLHILGFVVAAICIGSLGGGVVYAALALSPWEIWHRGEVWRLLSYVTYDPYFFSQRSLWFLWNMLLFYFFGREVEQFIGRKNFFALYVSLILIPAALFCLVGLLLPSWTYLNCSDVFFGVFVAFATIYPGAMPSRWIPLTVRALMWILLGISTLIDLALNDYPAIFMLWVCTGLAYLAMRMIGAGRGMNWLSDWLDERRVKKLTQERNFKIVQEKKTTESIDAILDKISKQGVNSLNAQERAALENARTKLLQRDER